MSGGEPSGFRVVRATDPSRFFERCWDALVAREAEHNLLLGLAPRLISGDHPFGSPLLLAWVEDETGAVAGHLFRTPPYRLCLSDLPAAAIDQALEVCAEVWDRIPGVLGPEETARRAPDAWAARTGEHHRPGMRMRIHRVERLSEADPPRGRARPAEPEDALFAIEWLRAFTREAGVPGTDPVRMVREMIAAGALHLWVVDGRPVSMAAAVAATPNGMRVGGVYTPPELRGRGYATAITSAVTRWILNDRGRRFAFLYTDLDNPTSNHIYARLGYEPVADVAEYLFESLDPLPESSR